MKYYNPFELLNNYSPEAERVIEQWARFGEWTNEPIAPREKLKKKCLAIAGEQTVLKELRKKDRNWTASDINYDKITLEYQPVKREPDLKHRITGETVEVKQYTDYWFDICVDRGVFYVSTGGKPLNAHFHGADNVITVNESLTTVAQLDLSTCELMPTGSYKFKILSVRRT